MIVVDASATLSALLNAGPARTVFAHEQLHAPQLLDFEVAAGLRRSVKVQHLEANAGWNALYVLRRLGIKRYPVFPLLAGCGNFRSRSRCTTRRTLPWPSSWVAACSLPTRDWAERLVSAAPSPSCPGRPRPRGRTPPAAATTELLRLGTIPGQDQDHIG